MVSDNKFDFLIRYMVIHIRDGFIYAFRYKSYFVRRSFGSRMEVYKKMLRLQRMPIELRMIVIILCGKKDGKHTKKKKREFIYFHKKGTRSIPSFFISTFSFYDGNFYDGRVRVIAAFCFYAGKVDSRLYP